MNKLTADFKGKKALVADDYAINLELTKELMELMGCNVDIAEDGAQTIDKYNSNDYDVIMMDVQMPEMDGYQVTKAIRKIEESKEKRYTPIIAMTANALPGDDKKCLDAGMDDYISKPVKGEYLQKILTKYLG